MAGTLIVSLDFELLWGVLDFDDPKAYMPNVLGGREAVPRLLKLFEEYNIHATWATVGFMFAENYDELKKYFPADTLRPAYENTKLYPYDKFKEIGENEEAEPCFYGSSLIKLISEAPGQEIGSHTFSHYYCREKGQNPEQFKADMTAALRLASDKGFTLKSVVLPRNQCTDECVTVLTELGFTAYRDEENDWIHEKIGFRPLMRVLRLVDVYFPITGKGGYLPEKENGIVNLVGSRMYKPYFKPLAFMEGLKVRRIKKQMTNAAKKGLTFHLWWHPHNIGAKTDLHFKQLQSIFSHYSMLKDKYGMESLNMSEAADKAGKR